MPPPALGVWDTAARLCRAAGFASSVCAQRNFFRAAQCDVETRRGRIRHLTEELLWRLGRAKALIRAFDVARAPTELRGAVRGSLAELETSLASSGFSGINAGQGEGVSRSFDELVGIITGTGVGGG